MAQKKTQKRKQQQQNPWESLEKSFEKGKAPPTTKKKKESPTSLKEHVEQTVVNFTKIPEHLIAELLGQKNYTDLEDPEVKKKIEESHAEQDDTSASIAEVRRQIKQLRDEEEQARMYFKKKEQEKEQKEKEEEERKRQEEEEKKRQQAAAMEEPSTKPKRGSLFARKKKPKKTIENKAAQGKQ